MQPLPAKDALTPPAAIWRYAAAAVPAVAYVHAAWMSWHKWGDLVVDAGVEYELPRKLAAGQLLYRDVVYGFGPLPEYCNALLYRLFGVHANVLNAAGLTIAALMCVLLYRLVRCFAGRLCACSVTVAFIYICAFAHLSLNASFNFVIPYTFAATYGMLFATASLFFLIRHVQKGAPAKFWLSVLFLALVALSKIEILFAVGMLHLAFLAAHGLMGRLSPRLHFAGYGAALALVVLVYAFFFVNAPGMFRDNPWFSPSAGARLYVSNVMGLANWPLALWTCARYSLLSLAGLLAIVWLLSAILIRSQTAALAFPLPLREGVGGGTLADESVFQRSLTIETTVGPFLRIPSALLRVLRGETSVLAAAFLAGALIYWLVPKKFAFLVLPELFAALLIFQVVRWFRTPAQRQQALPLLLLLVFALAVLARIPLRTWAWHYGFYLLPVPLAALAVLWFRAFPRWLACPHRSFTAEDAKCAEKKQTERAVNPFVSLAYAFLCVLRGEKSGLARAAPVFAAAGVGMLFSLSLGHCRISARNYALHTVTLKTGRGDLCLLGPVSEEWPYGEAYGECVQYLSGLPRQTRALVVPQGVGLVFFSGLDSPYGATSYYAVVAEDYYTSRVLPALQSLPPDVVVRVRVDDSEFGSKGFGVDYAVDVWKWIAQNYEPVKTIGPGGFITILKRR